MITLAELQAKFPADGWTQDRYDLLTSEVNHMAALVNLSRYGPVWTLLDTLATYTFSDAVRSGNWILRAGVSNAGDTDTLVLDRQRFDSTPLPWTGINVPGLDPGDITPALAVQDDTVRLFLYDGGEIGYYECADITAETPGWGDWTVVATVASVTHLAPVSLTKVHYARTNAQHNRVLGFYEYGSEWTDTPSDILWPYPITSFDAVKLAGYDVILATTDFAPLYGARVVGTVVSSTFNRISGIAIFHEQRGTWSEIQAFDLVDNQVCVARSKLRLTYHNGILFASYYWMRYFGENKTEDVTRCYVSRSKDGMTWEHPELIEPAAFSGETPLAPFCVIPMDNLYAVGASTLFSPPCVWAGQDPTPVDITDYVLTLESSAADARESGAEMSNPADVLRSTLACSNDRLLATYAMGYQVGADKIKTQVSTEDVITRDEMRQLPKRGIRLRSNDVLARMARAKGVNATEWDSQQIGRDNFEDTTGTGYGGTRFLAQIEGSWKTVGNVLQLASSNHEGLGASTFVVNSMNGAVSTGLKITYGSTHAEYAGLAFRILDKDNYFYVAYYGQDNTIRVGKCLASVKTVIDTVAAPSPNWAVGVFKYLKVFARYSRVHIYTSDDGITWTALSFSGSTEVELPGTASLPGTYTSWAGKWGLIGNGYSSVDTAPPVTIPIWPVPITPPDIRELVLIHNPTQMAITNNFGNPRPTWHSVSIPEGGTIFAATVDKSTHEIWFTLNHASPNIAGVYHIAPGVYNATLSLSSASAAALIWAQWLAHLYVDPETTPWTSVDMRSIRSMDDGSVVTSNVIWDGFRDRPPSGIFKGTSGGWTVSVASWTNPIFWMDNYADCPCAQIDFFNGQIYLAGTLGFYRYGTMHGAIVTGDGTNWSPSWGGTSWTAQRLVSCVVVAGGSVITVADGSHETLTYPDTSYEPALNYGHGFRKTSSSQGEYVEIRYLDNGPLDNPAAQHNAVYVNGAEIYANEDLWEHTVLIRAVRKIDSTRFVFVPHGTKLTGMVVACMDSGILQDKTGNLLSVLGGLGWHTGSISAYDNVAIEYAQGTQEE